MTSCLVFSEDGGVVGCCAKEVAGEAPTILVSVSLHGISMQATLSYAAALVLGKAITQAAAELSLQVEMLAVESMQVEVGGE